ncbi:vitellin-degrading protease-like [Cydia strobilella]|uniref:vitellin-degrading protease-like n=1 Tax=Cydia strobilella TaxID=1100964 RepID=UPI0030045C90
MFNWVLGCAFFGLVVSTPTPSIENVKIVGGEEINISEAPFQVSMVYRGRHSCGGAIIAEDMVLTAAHCVIGSSPTDYHIRVGSSSSKEGGLLVPVADLIYHPSFSYTKMDSDIALLRLSTPLEFSDTVKSIKMMEDGEEIDDGAITEVSGWGNTKEGGGSPSTLQKVLVPVVNEQVCRSAYSPLYVITPRMLCAGVPAGGKDACQGDSGGPLVHDGKLAGVVSWGIGCARPTYPGVYAKVSALRTWVDDNIIFLRIKSWLRY